MYSKINAYIDRLVNDSRPDAPMWNIENIRMGKAPHWNYIDGCMVCAFMEIAEITGNKKYSDFVEQFVDYYVFDDGTIRGYDKEKYNQNIIKYKNIGQEGRCFQQSMCGKERDYEISDVERRIEGVLLE